VIRIKYFAKLSESLDIKSESIEYNERFDTVETLIQSLLERGEPWTTEFSSQTPVLVAVNHELCDRQTALKKGDEVAFFPPVTGG
jgi:molybdopterin synthase sulfur carrier subunit